MRRVPALLAYLPCLMIAKNRGEFRDPHGILSSPQPKSCSSAGCRLLVSLKADILTKTSARAKSTTVQVGQSADGM